MHLSIFNCITGIIVFRIYPEIRIFRSHLGCFCNSSRSDEKKFWWVRGGRGSKTCEMYYSFSWILGNFLWHQCLMKPLECRRMHNFALRFQKFSSLDTHIPPEWYCAWRAATGCPYFRIFNDEPLWCLIIRKIMTIYLWVLRFYRQLLYFELLFACLNEQLIPLINWF